MKQYFLFALFLLPASANAFEPIGRVDARLSSASFDDREVIGPQVNLGRRKDGSWGGLLRGRVLDVTVSENRIVGVDFDIHIERTVDYVRFRGYVFGQLIYIAWPTDLPIDHWGWFRFSGVAAQANPPTPQFLFALLAAAFANRY